MHKLFLLIISTLFLAASPVELSAQDTVEEQEVCVGKNVLPEKEGDKCKFSTYIEIKKAYISGISIFVHQGTEIKASIFNEFGVSAIDFGYNIKRDKIKIYHVFKPLNRWFIKRMLRKNLLSLIHEMQNGKSEYVDSRHQIKYILKPIN